MTQDHPSKLSFSIEESVWLNKGQEVDEIVSLSLDPEITVQEQGDYVLIRGCLKLTGEYRTSKSNVSEGDNEELLASQVAFRSIEEVMVTEDGLGQIRHNFPIDVTIPQERINSLDDIYVIINSFDYDLPERGCIQLTADVSITGMSSGNSKREETDKVMESTEIEQEEIERTFHYEAYHQEQIEEADEEIIAQFPTESENDEIETVEDRDEENNVELTIENEETVIQDGKAPSIAFGVVKDRPTNQDSAISQEPIGMLKIFTGNQIKPRTEANPQPEARAEANEAELINADQIIAAKPQSAARTEANEAELINADQIIAAKPQSAARTEANKAELYVDQLIAAKPQSEAQTDRNQIELNTQIGTEVTQQLEVINKTNELVAEDFLVKANPQPQARNEVVANEVLEAKLKSQPKARNEEPVVEAKKQEPELSNKAEGIKTKTPREENALYLTKMLTKEDGEHFKKLKICIIRENETLETIASRYKVTQSILIKANRLNDANIQVGQILYIPVTQ